MARNEEGIENQSGLCVSYSVAALNNFVGLRKPIGLDFTGQMGTRKM